MGRGFIPGTIGKISCHNLFITYFTLTFFSSIDFYIAEKIFELTNCEIKSLKELPFCFESGFKKISNNVDLYNDVRKVFVKFNQDVDIWMEIPIQQDVYIWANYSVSSYSNFIPIYWNVLIWLKYDYMHIFVHHLCAPSFLVLWYNYNLWDHCADTRSWIRGQIRIFEGKYRYWRTNTDFIMKANSLHWLLAIIGHAKTNILQQNMW